MTDPNLTLVLDELENAKRKHPHFIDYFCELSSTVADSMLANQRDSLNKFAEWGTCDFRAVLVCEMWETMSAYAQGDLAHERQELAQCAAVCIRGMEYIENEQTKQENDTNG